MKRSKAARVAAASGAIAMAAAGVVALGQGTASAAQDSYNWSDGNDGLTRTISNVTPAAGDTITVWTTIKRNGGVVEYVQAAKDAHPACWKYVPGSAQVNGAEKTLDSSAVGDASTMGWQRVTGSWPIYPNLNPRTVWFTMQYKIGADCPVGTPMKGSFFYSTSLGDGNENNVGPAVTVQANQSTTTTLSAPGTATTGQAVNLTATVSPSAAGGTVQFMDNGQAVGSATAVSGGTATLSQTFTSVGAHSITAVYNGAPGYSGSASTASTVTVSDPAPVDKDTTTTVTVPPTAAAGSAVDLTATVAPSVAVGTVQFKDNGQAIGSPVTLAGGTATLSHVFTSTGAHNITAVYSGDTGFTGSTSQASTIAVSGAGGGTGGDTGGSGSLNSLTNIFGS